MLISTTALILRDYVDVCFVIAFDIWMFDTGLVLDRARKRRLRCRWSLNPSELLLLQGLLCAMLPATLRDVPVYLPVTNPLKPVRLVTVALCAGAELALLCADTPTLGDAGKLARRYLIGVAKILKDAVEQSQQQGWPTSITGNPNIQACVFVRRSPHPQVWTYQPAMAARRLMPEGANTSGSPAAGMLRPRGMTVQMTSTASSRAQTAAAKGEEEMDPCLRNLTTFAHLVAPLTDTDPSPGPGQAKESRDSDVPPNSTPTHVQMLTEDNRLVLMMEDSCEIFIAMPSHIEQPGAKALTQSALQVLAQHFVVP